MTTEDAFMAGTVQRSEIDALIGQRVHHVLWRRKIPQTELAATLGITQSTLSRRLRGESAWFAGDLVALSEALGVSVGWLFGEEETVRPKGLEPLTFWLGAWRLLRAALLGRRRPVAARWCYASHPVGGVVRSDDLELAA